MSVDWTNSDDHVLITADATLRVVTIEVPGEFDVMDARLARRRADDLIRAADELDLASRANGGSE